VEQIMIVTEQVCHRVWTQDAISRSYLHTWLSNLQSNLVPPVMHMIRIYVHGSNPIRCLLFMNIPIFRPKCHDKDS